MTNNYKQYFVSSGMYFGLLFQTYFKSSIGKGKLIIYTCITRETLVFTFFLASVSFDFEPRIMSTCMSTSRSNYIDMSIWKKHADHSTSWYGSKNQYFILLPGQILYRKPGGLQDNLYRGQIQKLLQYCQKHTNIFLLL